MKKILLTFVSAILTITFTAAAFAAHHLPFEYGQLYTLKVSDPAALLAAMQKFRNSPIGKQNPSGVSLSQFIANGESDATHSISVTYPTAAAMDASRKMNAGSPEVAEVGKVFQSVSEPESSGLFMLMKAEIVEGAITSANPVSMSIGLAVTDQAAFMAAIDKLWDGSHPCCGLSGQRHGNTDAGFPGHAVFTRDDRLSEQCRQFPSDRQQNDRC